MHPKDGRVVSNFIVQALQGDPLTIYGDGSQTRSFCYVQDLIDVLVRLMDSDDDIIGPINIGNPEEYTMKELAEKVIEMTGSKSELIFEALPSDDPTKRQPDISIARQVLNWQPTTQLDQGLAQTIKYFRVVLSQ